MAPRSPVAWGWEAGSAPLQAPGPGCVTRSLQLPLRSGHQFGRQTTGTGRTPHPSSDTREAPSSPGKGGTAAAHNTEAGTRQPTFSHLYLKGTAKPTLGTAVSLLSAAIKRLYTTKADKSKRLYTDTGVGVACFFKTFFCPFFLFFFFKYPFS